MSSRLSLLLAGALIASLGLCSCRKRAEDSQRRPQLVQRPSPASSAPVAEAEPETGYSLQPFARIGIQECDDYLVKYRACLAQRIPAADRRALLESLRQTAQAWRQAASTDQGRLQLKGACEMAEAAGKAAMVAYGCDW